MSRATALRSEAGFTLVEMLVALVIFALLAAAGVGVLRSSVDTQTAVSARLTELGGLGRLHALLASDVAQAVDRSTRSRGGHRPAFAGEPNAMHLVRGGWANLDGSPRSELQRVSWGLAGQSLARTAHRNLDGGDDGSTAVPVVQTVQGLGFRYRLADGSWTGSFSSTDVQPLPAAVEMTLTPARGDAIVIVLAFPAGTAPQQAEGQAA